MRNRWIGASLLVTVLSLAAGTAAAKLVVYYPLDEGSGTTAQDASGNNHNGAIQGTPTRVDGQPGFGRALFYSGNNPAAGWVNCGIWNPSAGTGQLTVAIKDSTGKLAVVTNLDSAAVTMTTWTEWKIPLSSFTGVNPAKVKKMYIGVGDRKNPVADGAGRLYIDNIRIMKMGN
jgi:hypothetical protein